MLCPVCSGKAALFDVVDFSKSCEDLRRKPDPLSGLPIYYARCGGCGFCFAPAMCLWSLEEFADKVYNAGYKAVDPDYVRTRPMANALALRNSYPGFKGRHLDYGGGNGLLSASLGAGWDSTSYDPFIDKTLPKGRFDLITAFEVFEHVPDPNVLIQTLLGLMSDDCMILFSTLVSDGQITPGKRLDWWYASPRNGHISLFTRKALVKLAEKHGLTAISVNDGVHTYWKQQPSWLR